MFPKVSPAVPRAGAGRRYRWVAPPPELSGLSRRYSRRCSVSFPTGCCSGEGVVPIPGVSCGHPGSPRGCSAPIPAGCCGAGVIASVSGVSCVPPGIHSQDRDRWDAVMGGDWTAPSALGDHDGACGSPVGHSWPPKPFRLGSLAPVRVLGVPLAHPAVQGQDLLPALGTLGNPEEMGGCMGGH